MRHTHRIHPEDVMKADELIDVILSISVAVILALVLALLRGLS